MMILLLALLVAVCKAEYGNPTTALILDGYDLTVPPLGIQGSTQVKMGLQFTSVNQIAEKQMELQLGLNEYLVWNDPRLKYENTKGIPDYLKNSRVDFTRERYEIWQPSIQYTEESSQENRTETMYLYPNGTVLLIRQYELQLTCSFQYHNIPNDEHICHTVSFIQNEWDTTAHLEFSDKFGNGQEIQFQSWFVQLSYLENVAVRYKSLPEGASSGLKWAFTFQRKSSSLVKLFIVPSLLFVALAYASFYINQAAAPARVTLCVLNILNAVYLLGSTTQYVPDVPYKTWLTDFLTWNLVFTTIPILQYAMLNSSTVEYGQTKSKINNLFLELKALANKENKWNEVESLLNLCRKELSHILRKNLTGGEMLTIGDLHLYIDSKQMKKLYKIDQERPKKEKIKFEIIRKLKKEGKDDDDFDNINLERMVEEEYLRQYPAKDHSAKKKKKKNKELEQQLSKTMADRMSELAVTKGGEQVETKKQIHRMMNESNAFDLISMYLQDKVKVQQTTMRKFIRILELETSFSIGRKELVSNNFDFVFRWLYLLAFMVLLSVQITSLYDEFTILGAGIVLGLVFLICFLYLVVSYRMKTSNLSGCQAVMFYLRCKCFKTKQLLESYMT